MKKTILILITALLAIALFFYFQKSESLKVENKKDKPISKTPAPKKEEIKKTTVKPKAKEEKQTIKEDLPKLDLELKVDKNEFYKNQKYDRVKSIDSNSTKKDEKDFDFDVGVDVDKKKKEIDGFNFNLEKKF